MRTQDFYCFINPTPYETVIDYVNVILHKHGFTVDTGKNSDYYLRSYEIGDDEYYFGHQSIISAKETLSQLKAHPAGGYLIYEYSQHEYNQLELLVGYENTQEILAKANSVFFSVQHDFYLREKEFMYAFLKELHNQLQAVRTIGACDMDDYHHEVPVEAWEDTMNKSILHTYEVDWRG